MSANAPNLEKERFLKAVNHVKERQNLVEIERLDWQRSDEFISKLSFFGKL